MKLGEKIIVFRNVKGYSQEAMAESLNLSVTGYGKIERDVTELTVSRLQQIADVLEVRIEEILQFDETVLTQKKSGLKADNFGKVQNYYSRNEAFETLKTIYESRIQWLEVEVKELKKQLFDIMK